jgi:hypothetical protein
MDLPRLIHEIARCTLPFITAPDKVRERAETGFLTPDDCLQIAEQLGALGRDLAQSEVEKAMSMGQESVHLISLTREEGHLRDLTKALQSGSEKQSLRVYHRLSRFLASLRGNSH